MRAALATLPWSSTMISSTWSSPSSSWVMSRVARPAVSGQQVGGQRGAGFGVQVGGRLVEDQHGRVGEQRPGQREPLPFAAGHGGPVRADRGVPAPRKRIDPGQQPGPGRGGRQLVVGGAGPGQPQVVADGARRRCAGPGDSRR